MNKKLLSLILIIALVLSLFSLTGCTKQNDPDTPAEPETTTEPAPTEAELKLADMTLEEKVAQLIFVIPDAFVSSINDEQRNDSKADGTTAVTDEIREMYSKYPVGGFILFAKNIIDPEQLKQYTSDLHSLGKITPIITIDEEGGNITRIAKNENFSVTKFEPNAKIAETKDTKNAYTLGKTIGAYLTEYGIDLDFAPVADVNTNPNNTVIGSRAFGTDPKLAGEMVASVIKGLHDSDNMSCIKHFPGHGDTSTDTHKGYAETNKTWDEIKNCEMIPFIAGINAGTDMVMVAHVCAPNVTNDKTPASLSYTLLTEKLRGELGYNGVIITDAMNMGAITNEYSSSEAAVLAIKAGVDIVLCPNDFVKAYNGILDAVNSGGITEERLDESVLRILNLKYKG